MTFSYDYTIAGGGITGTVLVSQLHPSLSHASILLLKAESAFRTLQEGKITGKIVIVPRPDDQVKVAPSKTPKNLPLADATYIIIRGTGGLDRSMTRWMIEKGTRNILLISRSGKATGKVADLVEDAKFQSAQVVVRPCDVSDKGQVENLIKEVISNLLPVKGIIHVAMILTVSIIPPISIPILLTTSRMSYLRR
jgi:hypothetical protein